ncbi:MAG: sulfatase-like hydrolase/transferase [Lachnospiraceae bacterium]|nr:sulfatase-like hydrolase/transferase [Lachnospiraceae bacterium]
MALIFYPLAIVFWEMLLRILDDVNPFWDISLIPMVLFSLSFGFLLSFVFLIIKNKRFSRILSAIVLFLLAFVFFFEYNCISFYKIYYGLFYAIGMTGQVLGEFADLAGEVALGNIGMAVFFALPFIFYIVFAKKIIADDTDKLHRKRPLVLIPFAALMLAAVMFMRLGPKADVYTYAFSVPGCVPATGLLTALRLDLCYRIIGTPEEGVKTGAEQTALWTPQAPAKPASSASVNAAVSGNSAVSGNAVSENAAEEPVVYGYNAAVDFAALIDEESDPAYKSMHEYFGSLEPTQQNEYTGIFKDKNLILLTAEAFSPYAVDKDFTPTLYKMANESFVFTDYYQPGWGLSTTGGEFSNMTGLIPLWLDGSHSFLRSVGDAMPYAAGNLFGSAGYVCRAYHNSAFDYYDRDKTHPNLGYDYKGIGNGLKMELGGWPYSDLGMLEATTDEIIEEHLRTGVPFHTYYMTVSGHCNYSWGANAMSAKHKAEAQAAFPDESPTVQAYKACNKELDLALEYLLKRLDEEGILEDTVICMGADHYPYAMSKGEPDYYCEMSGIDDTAADISRYRNTLILYCAAIKEPVVVDTPCSSVDIMPTLANLFGIDYDSRLYSGRDIFAMNYEAGVASGTMPLVILPVSGGYSFVSPAGQYDAHSRSFTPNEGVEVEDGYVDKAKAIVSDRLKYARLIISKDYYRRAVAVGEE